MNPFPTPASPAATLRRITSIATTTIRGALRTRTITALITLLALTVLGLPFLLKGDGTPAGELAILLSYTLGTSFALLSLATLWSAATLFANEISAHRYTLDATKPVTTLEFWLGKWLALMTIATLLLTAAYTGVYAQVRWRASQNSWQSLHYPEGRAVTRPTLPTPEQEALEVYSIMAANRELPPKLSRRSILRILADQALERYEVINPEEEIQLSFTLNQPLKPGDPLLLRWRFDTEYSTREQIQALVNIWPHNHPELAITTTLSDFTQSELLSDIDTTTFATADPNNQGLSRFDLLFKHQGDPEQSAALMLRLRQDVALLASGRSFELNLARSALLQLSLLAALAALGLTLSTLFSTPVALFTATMTLTLILVSGSVIENTSETGDEKPWERLGLLISQTTHDIVKRATRDKPLEQLTRGELIDNQILLHSWLWNGVLPAIIFATLSTLAMRRREIAGD